jgi:hypothetical protein
MQRDSVAGMEKRIVNKVRVTSLELQNSLQVTPQYIDEAVKLNQLFAIGENYYPAFYAYVRLDRCLMEEVCGL